MTQEEKELLAGAVHDAIDGVNGKYFVSVVLGAYEVNIEGCVEEQGHWDGRTWLDEGSWVTDWLEVRIDEVCVLSMDEDVSDESLQCRAVEQEAWDVAEEAIEAYRCQQSYSRDFWREYA